MKWKELLIKTWFDSGEPPEGFESCFKAIEMQSPGFLSREVVWRDEFKGNQQQAVREIAKSLRKLKDEMNKNPRLVNEVRDIAEAGLLKANTQN